MNDPLSWNPEDWTSRESLESMIAAVGGATLTEALAEAAETRHAFEGILPQEKRRLYRIAVDASAEAALERENAATRVALVHGLGIGAALIVHGREADPDEVVDLAATFVTDLLASPLRPAVACSVAATVLDALRLAGIARAEPATAPAGQGPG